MWSCLDRINERDIFICIQFIDYCIFNLEKYLFFLKPLICL